MKLFIESMRSAASRKARRAAAETPCSSGLLRGRPAPKPGELPSVTRARADVTATNREGVRILAPWGRVEGGEATVQRPSLPPVGGRDHTYSTQGRQTRDSWGVPGGASGWAP